MPRGWQELARAAAAAAMAAGVITTTAAARAPSAAPAQVAVAPTRITAITGAQIEVAGSSMVVTRPGASHGLLELAVGGQRYLIPAAAVPYLGRVLDISLFRLSALAAAERDGRLPLTITYSGRLPVLPGVRVTAAGAGRASGYLTAASATRFAAALAHRQLAANVRVSLAGTAPAAAQRPSPQYRMHMLTVAGTNITGKPDNGDSVYVGDVSNGNAFGSGPGALSQFYKGTAKFSVPAGTYWAVGLFADPDGSFRLAVVPQFTVSGDTKVEVDERTATSKLSITTPEGLDLCGRHPRGLSVTADRQPADGRLAGFPGFSGVHQHDILEASRGRAGSLRERLNDAPGEGRLHLRARVQRHQRPDTPAALHGDTSIARDGTHEIVRLDPRCGFRSERRELHRLPACPDRMGLAEPPGDGSATQTGTATLYSPGSNATESWNAYPLHPAPNVNLIGAADVAGEIVSASRQGNLLSLDYWPFSDSVPGHTGTGFEPVSPSVSGTYQITADGQTIASGSALPLPTAVDWGFARQAILPAKPAVIGFTLTAIRSDQIYTLSTRSSTTWTWHSAYAAHHAIPGYWRCSATGGHDCVAQPLLTVGYTVAGIGLSGRTAPGTQTLGLTVGHLQLAAASAIKTVTAQVSFDAGQTWHAATVTGSGGSYKAVYSAPAGAFVTLRVTASDAAGGTIAETITRAYATT